MHLFDYLDSGNGFKVRLLFSQLGMKYQWTHVDIDKGLTRTPEFLRRNPNGRIPTLELDDGTHLFEHAEFHDGNAIGQAQRLNLIMGDEHDRHVDALL